MVRTQKYKRAKMIGVMEIRKSPLDPPMEGYALDISYGGMAVNLEHPIDGNVEVIIQFQGTAGRNIKETVTAHVIWCKSYGSFYRAGIEFDHLNDHDHPRLLTSS